MKPLKSLILFLCSVVSVHAAQSEIDSLLQAFNVNSKTHKNGELLNEIANFYITSNTDSAWHYIQRAENYARINHYPDLLADSYIGKATLLHNQKNSDSANYYLKKSLEIASDKNYLSLKLNSLINLGYFSYRQKDYSEASDYYREALAIVDKVDEKKMQIKLYNWVAILNRAIGKIDSSIYYYHAAIELCEQINDTHGLGILYSNMGLLYGKQNNTDLALDYLDKSLELKRKEGNQKGISASLINKGVVYEQMEEFNKAIDAYRQSLAIKKQVNDSLGIAKLYNNIGIIYRKSGELDSALYYCTASMVIRQELNDKLGTANTMFSMGQIFMIKKKYTDALSLFKRAEELIDGINHAGTQKKIYEGLYQSSEALGNYKDAFKYLIKYREVETELFNVESQRSIEDIETRYQTQKKEQENQLLKKEKEKQTAVIQRQKAVVLTIFITLILVLSIAVIIFINRRKEKRLNNLLEKQKEQIEIQNHELLQLSEYKELMMGMIVHDLKNPLNTIINSTDKNRIEYQARKMLNMVSNILDIQRINEAALKVKQEEVDLSELVHQVFDQIQLPAREKNIALHSNIEIQNYLQADSELLERILINLTTNAIKYTPNNGRILVKATVQESEEFVRIEVIDNGIGINPSKIDRIFNRYQQIDPQKMGVTSSTGLGLTFCKLAVEEMGGEIGAVSDGESGTVFWFTIKIGATMKTIKNDAPMLDKQSTILNAYHRSLIKDYLSELNNTHFYEVSKIRNVIRNVPDYNQNIISWREELLNAVHSGNEELYLLLTKNNNDEHQDISS